jgi:CRISPR-associated protein Cmr2
MGAAMSKYLLQINIGPVQPFIAASRKVRDLRAGSQLLVDLSSGVAQYVADHGGELIFPHHKGAEAANIILATVTKDPSHLVQEAEQNLHRQLAAKWDNLKFPLKEKVASETAKSQLSEAVEFFAAWTELDGSYQESRKRLGRLMAARKATRGFAQPRSLPGQPKSSLAPDRDTVLPVGKGLAVSQEFINRNPRVKGREHLDAMGVLKRFAAMGGGFESVASIAVLDIINSSNRISELQNLLDNLRDEDGNDMDVGEALLYDIPHSASTSSILQEVRTLRKAILKESRPVRPYYSILFGDGDSMGKVLNELARDGEEKHREFSKRLDEGFALQASDIVENRHGGCLIYAGGDDVLAMAPAHLALDIAKELHHCFDEAMQEYGVTLSVGIAICHIREDLRAALEFARTMEKKAKAVGGKNAVAVGVRTGSGSDETLALKWTDANLIEESIRLLDGGLSRGFPYELKRLHAEVRGMEGVGDLIQAEVKRIANRKKGLGLPVPGLGDVHGPDDLGTLSARLAIAHFMTRSGAGENEA